MVHYRVLFGVVFVVVCRYETGYEFYVCIVCWVMCSSVRLWIFLGGGALDC